MVGDTSLLCKRITTKREGESFVGGVMKCRKVIERVVLNRQLLTTDN